MAEPRGEEGGNKGSDRQGQCAGISLRFCGHPTRTHHNSGKGEALEQANSSPVPGGKTQEGGGEKGQNNHPGRRVQDRGGATT